MRRVTRCLIFVILLSIPGPNFFCSVLAMDQGVRTEPGILHEEIDIGERTPQALQPLHSSPAFFDSKQEHVERIVRPDSESLLDQMDVYALSSHAHLLARPRMVQPVFVLEAIRGKITLPTKDEWSPIIAQGSRCSGLDPKLIEAVIAVESGNNPDAISPAGAQGLMQLMPETQRYLGVLDPFDPVGNVRAGSLYLREQLDSFGSLELALAAYNAGPGSVRRYGGIPPFQETKNFIHKVQALYEGHSQKNIKTVAE